MTTTLSGTRLTLRSSASGSITNALRRSQRMEFDEILLVDDAARRRQRGDDEQRVADVGIGDPVNVPGVLEGYRDARAVGADEIAGELERAGRIDDGVADIDGPDPAVGGDAGQARTVELQPHHVGIAGVGKFEAANGAARLAVERAQIDRGFGVEDEPERVGALKHRHADRRLEGEGQLEIGALRVEIGGDFVGAVRFTRRRGGERRRRVACLVGGGAACGAATEAAGASGFTGAGSTVSPPGSRPPSAAPRRAAAFAAELRPARRRRRGRRIVLGDIGRRRQRTMDGGRRF